MSDDLDYAAVAEEFWASALAGEPYPPAWFDRLSMAQAERVQLALLDKRLALGEVHAGWKVGLTAKAIQEQFSVHEPVFGYLLGAGLITSGATLEYADILKPGYENEICLRMGSDLAGPGVTPEQARQAVAELHPAMELIESRGDFTAQLAVSVADNVQQKGFVLGPGMPIGDIDLREVTVVVTQNDQQVATGRGDAVLGDPLNSLAWLANKLAEHGRAIKAGQFIMAGSLTRQFPLAAGDRAVARFDPIGEVAVSLREGGRSVDL